MKNLSTPTYPIKNLDQSFGSKNSFTHSFLFGRKSEYCAHCLCLGCNTLFSDQKKTVCERQTFQSVELI